MFFDDEKLVLKRRANFRALPPIPETGWRPPQYFPNLSDASCIGIDCETEEKDWERGPGWARGPQGNIVGFSVSAVDRSRTQRGKWYFPVRHKVEPEYNLDPAKCFAWLKPTLENYIPKVGANLLYDMGWLTEENIFMQGPLYDVQFAEALIDENARTKLDNLGLKYCNEGKQTSILYDWIRRAYNPKEEEIRGDIFRSPPRLVGPYAEVDADLPIRVLEHQWPILSREGLLPVFHMECALIPLLVRMRMQGVRVNINKAEEVHSQIGKMIVKLHSDLVEMCGFDINVNASKDMAKVFDHFGLPYPRTAPTARNPDGNPSFIKDFIKNVDHPVAKLLNAIREHEKVKSTFIESYILEGSNNGRIHAQFHPLRSAEGGTGVGRFSSSDPNLQNIPIRTDLGKLTRTIFEKETHHIAWEKRDYSQLQYRGLAVKAVDKGDGSAEKLRNSYRTDPKTDYHAFVQRELAPLLHWDLTDKELVTQTRRPVKNINFGLIFGLGKKKLIRMLGLTGSQGEEFYKFYHQAVPYAKATMDACAAEMHDFGYIISPLGRRCRFNLWEPMFDNRDHSKPAYPYERALLYYGPAIKRAGEHKAIAYALQSFEGDVIKQSMVNCYEAGIFNVTGVPLIQVHDELDFSVIDDSPQQREAYLEMSRIMENSIAFTIPIRVDAKRGLNWGAVD